MYVVHCKRSAYDVYIGRPGVWGNPFVIGKDGDRVTVVAKYREWLLSQPELVARAKQELKGKILGCFCYPEACHGDVLSEIANEVNTTQFIDNWFSNFEPFDGEPFTEDGITYPTPEHYYQAMKVSRDEPGFREQRQAIADARTPGESKYLGKRIKVRPDWEQIKLQVMERVLRYKFRPGTSWHKQLMATNDKIVEVNNWHDNIWGACICDSCKDLHHRNSLGILLMKLREEFRNA